MVKRAARITTHWCLIRREAESFNALPSRERTEPEERNSRQFLLHFWLPKSGKKTNSYHPFL